MTLVSTRFPEDIPWFKASRRAVVADMGASCLRGCAARYQPYLLMQRVRLFQVKSSKRAEEDGGCMTWANDVQVFGADYVGFSWTRPSGRHSVIARRGIMISATDPELCESDA